MSNNDRPDVLVGRKLPGHSLWEQLQQRAQPLALEFCSQFFNNQMSYKAAVQWLASYGIKVSKNTLQGFYSSMDMRLRYASLQAAATAENAEKELPEDIEEATRKRIAMHKFELAYMNLGEQQRLQLIALQQSEDAMKGNFVLKKAKLMLDRAKFEEKSLALYLQWRLNKVLEEIADNPKMTQAEKIAAMRQEAFKDVDALLASGDLQIPK